MIYFCADDYGLSKSVSSNIMKQVKEKRLNKVSAFPNFDEVDLSEMPHEVRVALHLNLVEGKCMANAEDVSLLADNNGRFKHTFGGLFLLWLTRRHTLEAQLYTEIKAQIIRWKSILPESLPFCVDSHQHVHMIPSVFKVLLEVLRDEKIDLAYMRIPAEPLTPYIKKPSLYLTYSPVNIIKLLLLDFLWLIDKGLAKGCKIPTALFFGILFSGKMDGDRVNKVLPEFVALAKKRGCDIEVLFHPGYVDEEIDFKKRNIAFDRFYLSPHRKTEFNSLNKISERSVQK